MMRPFFSVILSGMAGGLIVLSGVYLMQRPLAPAPLQEGHAIQARYVNAAPQEAVIPFDFTVAAERAMPAVVHISSMANTSAQRGNYGDFFRYFFGEDGPDMGPSGGSGSGVIYTEDGYIITNNHVVEGADKLEVTLFDNRTFQATVVGTDKKTDLAVIKIEARDLPVLRPGDSDAARVGQWVLAVGNPFDLTSTVTAGIISAKGRNIQLLGGRDAIEAFIQTDAAVNPGNSGGALIDTEGRLLGINTAIATRTGTFSGYSFAIPVGLVTRIAEDIINYGSYQRAYLGVEISDLDQEAMDELGLTHSRGVVVENLTDGGSAQYAGILAKDVIIRVNDREIRDVPELQEVVGRAKVGEVLNIAVVRRGREVEIPVKLRPREN